MGDGKFPISVPETEGGGAGAEGPFTDGRGNYFPLPEMWCA